MTANRIDFVDEDDAGGILLTLFEQIAYAACAYADEHFYEVGTGNREEGNIRFSSNRTGQQSLAGPGRPD